MQIAGHYANCLVGMMALWKLPPTNETFCKMPKQFANCYKNQHYAKCPISHIPITSILGTEVLVGLRSSRHSAYSMNEHCVHRYQGWLVG